MPRAGRMVGNACLDREAGRHTFYSVVALVGPS